MLGGFFNWYYMYHLSQRYEQEKRRKARMQSWSAVSEAHKKAHARKKSKTSKTK